MTIVSPVPNTLQNGQTADAPQVMANFNSIVTDVNAKAAASGANSDITALLALSTPISYLLGGTQVWIGGTVTGTANAIVLAAPTPAAGFTLVTGYIVTFVPTASNSNTTTLNVFGTGIKNVFKVTPAGVAACAGGEIINGQIVAVVYDGTQFVLINPVVTTSGALANTGAFSSSASAVWTGVITPTALSGNTNDWAPTSFSTAYKVRASASATYNLTGIAGGATGREIILENVGTFNITLTSNDAGSTAANRFLFARPLILGPNEVVALSYDGTASGWRARAPFIAQPIAGGFKNLKVQATANTTVTVTADAITLEDANGEAYRAQTISTSINSAVTGANGLDTGAMANATWYSVWIIYNPTTNTVAGLISISATAPTMPSGYTFKARNGWVITDGSANFKRTLQYGRTAQYVVGTNPATSVIVASGVTGTYSVTSPTLSAVSVATVVPTTAVRITLGLNENWKGGATSAIQVAPNTAWGGTNNGQSGSAGNVWFVAMPILGSPGNYNWPSITMLLEATTIAVAMDGAGGAISCLGWEDNL